MIEIYINNALRSDIEPQVGGSLEQTAEHTTSSSISIKIPVASAVINACDYIQFVEDSIIIFAGTVLGIQQQDMGYSGQIDYKVFDLTIASNADFIASKFVDMTFPAGVSIKHIVMGNHVTDAWYNAALGQFTGVFAQCIATEGITLGVVDDFTTQVLSETALLWGMSVYDLLDQLCSTVGGWWEITPDKVFSMRYTASRENTPFVLDETAQIFDLTPTIDAYTQYSGVRVVGGIGKGQGAYFRTFDNSPDGVIYYKGNVLYLRYPVDSFETTYPLYQHDYNYDTNTEIWAEWKVGFKGLHDDDPTYQVLTSYGSNEITLKSGYSFFDLSGEYDEQKFIRLHYVPLVRMYARLIDDDLVAQIKAQRDGSGIIEYLLENESLITYEDTVSAGRSFLRDNAKQSKQVKFKTNSAGFAVGQHMYGHLPYYGIDGDYQVSSVSAAIVSDADSSIMWEFDISISSALYRDSLKNLFYSNKQIDFKIGTDFPAADGRSIASEIEIRTTITWYAYQGQTWADFEASYTTWADLESKYSAWSEILMIYDEVSKMGNFLTATAKDRIAKALSGQALAVDVVNIVSSMQLLNGVTSLLFGAIPVETRLMADGVETVFYVNAETVLSAQTDKMNMIKFIGGSWNVLQSIPLVIDKTAGNPQGPYALTIVKRDVII